MIGRSVHIRATKAWVITRIIEDWRSGKSLEWIDLKPGRRPAAEVAEKIIECVKDHREYFVMGECDNQLPDGSCGGHPSESEGAAAEKSVLPSSTRVTPDNPSSTKADDVFATLSPDGAAVSDLSSGAVFWPNTVPNRVRNANALVPLLDGSRRVVGWVPVTDSEVEEDLRPRPYEPTSNHYGHITRRLIRRAAESFADRFGGASC